MDRIRSQGKLPAFWSGIEWPADGIVFPDGCVKDLDAIGNQVIVEHSDDDGATWTIVHGTAAIGGGGTSPTTGPDPAVPVAPDFAGAAARGIRVKIPEPQATQPLAPSPVVDAANAKPVGELMAQRDKAPRHGGRGKWKA